MAGYCGTPLPKKLGVKEQSRVCLLAMLTEVAAELKDALAGCRVAEDNLDFAMMFVKTQAELKKQFAPAAKLLAPAGMLWVRPATVVIEIDDYVETKIAAFAAHTSQAPLLPLVEKHFHRHGKKEMFHLAASVGKGAEGVEDDLFAGVTDDDGSRGQGGLALSNGHEGLPVAVLDFTGNCYPRIRHPVDSKTCQYGLGNSGEYFNNHRI